MTMTTIWKYELRAENSQIIEMPLGAEILTVMVQGVIPCLWVRTDPNKNMKTEGRGIVTHGTGHDVPSTTGQYIGSYQLLGGSLVFHVFEQKEAP